MSSPLMFISTLLYCKDRIPLWTKRARYDPLGGPTNTDFDWLATKSNTQMNTVSGSWMTRKSRSSPTPRSSPRLSSPSMMPFSTLVAMARRSTWLLTLSTGSWRLMWVFSSALMSPWEIWWYCHIIVLELGKDRVGYLPRTRCFEPRHRYRGQAHCCGA